MGGTVKQQMLTLPQAVSQEELMRISNRLNEHLGGLNTDQIRALAFGLSMFESNVVGMVLDLMRQVDTRTMQDVYRDGVMDILRQPEFSAIERMQALLEMLEQRSTLETMMSDLAPAQGVHVVIGSENQYDDMSDYSMVLTRYGLPGEATGIVGVLGPVRMQYARSIGAVRYVAGLLDDLMARMHGR